MASVAFCKKTQKLVARAFVHGREILEQWQKNKTRPTSLPKTPHSRVILVLQDLRLERKRFLASTAADVTDTPLQEWLPEPLVLNGRRSTPSLSMCQTVLKNGNPQELLLLNVVPPELRDEAEALLQNAFTSRDYQKQHAKEFAKLLLLHNMKPARPYTIQISDHDRAKRKRPNKTSSKPSEVQIRAEQDRIRKATAALDLGIQYLHAHYTTYELPATVYIKPLPSHYYLAQHKCDTRCFYICPICFAMDFIIHGVKQATTAFKIEPHTWNIVCDNCHCRAVRLYLRGHMLVMPNASVICCTRCAAPCNAKIGSFSGKMPHPFLCVKCKK